MTYNPPDYYIYDADVYCADYTEKLKQRLQAQGQRPENEQDQRTYDSCVWPKGPYSDEESDVPEHCRSCGKFLECPLTEAGERYVQEKHAERPSEVTQLWMEFYGLDLLSQVWVIRRQP